MQNNKRLLSLALISVSLFSCSSTNDQTSSLDFFHMSYDQYTADQEVLQGKNVFAHEYDCSESDGGTGKGLDMCDLLEVDNVPLQENCPFGNINMECHVAVEPVFSKEMDYFSRFFENGEKAYLFYRLCVYPIEDESVAKYFQTLLSLPLENYRLQEGYGLRRYYLTDKYYNVYENQVELSFDPYPIFSMYPNGFKFYVSVSMKNGDDEVPLPCSFSHQRYSAQYHSDKTGIDLKQISDASSLFLRSDIFPNE